VKKRWRKPKANDNEIKIQYGNINGEINICYFYGKDFQSQDVHLFHWFLNNKKSTDYIHGSFLEELKNRGYDISTLKISIQKRS